MRRIATRSASGSVAEVPWRRALLAWYRRHRRNLPWRRSRDPYRVWVSEVMLQQTQVATATPYYQTFLARFPTLTALARARPAQVLAAWAGLGYYRRARHLHAAAREVVREHEGRVPDRIETFGGLPGVGRYTAGAVLSIAFDRPLAALDGNVARVLARLHARRLSVRDPRGARALWSLAEGLVPMRRPGDWNQALMELGATVCLPRAPDCDRCPIRDWCRAWALGRTGDFPAPAPRRPVVRVRRAVALIRHRGRVLVVLREGPLLEGLWEPPGVELSDGEPAGRVLARALGRLGIDTTLTPTGRTLRHAITHRAITVEVWEGSVRGTLRGAIGMRAFGARTENLPLSALGRRVVTLALGSRPGRREARRDHPPPMARRRALG